MAGEQPLVPQPVCFHLDGTQPLLAVTQNRALADLPCPCLLRDQTLTMDVILLMVNMVLQSKDIGLLAFRVHDMSSYKPSLHSHAMWCIYAIPAYPTRANQMLPLHHCKAMGNLRRDLKSAFRGADFLSGNATMSVTCSEFDLEGCALLNEEPANRLGTRTIPTTEGFVYGKIQPSCVIYVLMSIGKCTRCQQRYISPA